ncbi:MAG: hypothetical protein HC930_15845 [Hydrococcus sp. SU_1_0]|nr:hypothetical protein [Hydrococcus sp. SU_1_0]
MRGRGFAIRLSPHKQEALLDSGKTLEELEAEGQIIINIKCANSHSQIINEILNTSQPVIVGSDSQKKLEILHQMIDNQSEEIGLDDLEEKLKQQGKFGIRIDKKTVNSPAIKAFMANPDEWISDNKPDYILYSPSAESGIDISIRDYFTGGHYLLFNGVIDVDSAIQMLGRVRDSNVIKTVYARQFSIIKDEGLRSHLPSLLQKSEQEFIDSDLARIMQDYQSEYNELSYQYWQESQNAIANTAYTYQSIWNMEKSNYREMLRKALSNRGYEIESLYGTRDSIEFNKYWADNRDEVEIREVNHIINAPEPKEMVKIAVVGKKKPKLIIIGFFRVSKILLIGMMTFYYTSGLVPVKKMNF